MVYTGRMTRSLPRFLAAILTLAIVGAFAYWALRPLVHPPAVVAVSPSAIKHPGKAIEVPPGWVKIDTKQGFTLYAPPGTQFHPLPGEDSFVGEITGPAFQFVGHLLPTSWILDGLRGIVLRGFSVPDVMPAFGFALAWALGLFLIAVWRFRLSD